MGLTVKAALLLFSFCLMVLALGLPFSGVLSGEVSVGPVVSTAPLTAAESFSWPGDVFVLLGKAVKSVWLLVSKAAGLLA
jgi:hypothetical protein